jgi:hypothetical protein
MGVAGNYVYMVLVVTGFGDDGHLEVVDISNPSRPQRVGGYGFAHVNGVAVSGIQVYLVYRVANP